MDDSALLIEQQIDISEKNLGRLLDWNGRFDNKSSVLIAIDFGIMGVLALVSHSRYSLYEEISIGLSLGFLAVSILSIIYGEYPRIKPPSNSLIYSNTIARRNLETFKSDFKKLSKEGYLVDLLDQCYVNARIIDRKAHSFRFGLLWTVAAIVPWTVAVFF